MAGLLLIYVFPYLILSESLSEADAQEFALSFGASPEGAWILILAVFVTTLLAIWTAWSFATRGGFAMGLTGLALGRQDGRAADRWRCGGMTLLSWLARACLLVGSVWVSQAYPTLAWARWALYGLALASAIVALVFPSGGPIEWISGLSVVPK